MERDILKTVDLFLNGDGSGIGGRDLIRKLADEVELLRADNARLADTIWELSGKKDVQAQLERLRCLP